jgi:N-acetylmuramoyl-L-alanine amidase
VYLATLVAGTGLEMMSYIRSSVCAIFLLILLTASPAFAKKSVRKPDAKTLYDTAVRLENDLNNSKTPAPVSSWKKVVAAYRSVYYTYPTSGYCDNALFQIGNLYAEMAEVFNDTFYYHRAAATYQFLINEYPSSSLIKNAKLESARINKEIAKGSSGNPVAESGAPETNPTGDNLAESDIVPAPAPDAASASEPQASRDHPAILKNLRHYTGDDYTRIVIDFDKEVSLKKDRLSDPDRLYFDFDNTVAVKSLLQENVPVDDGFLKQIRVGQNTATKTRVVLDLKSIDKYEVFSLYHPYRVVIDVQGKKDISAPETAANTAIPDAEIKAPEMNTSGRYSLARQLGLKVRRIIVDAGHGGHDPGAMAGGLREKDITLDVARKLRTILQEKYDFEVLMTRDSDVFVPLEERTAFANSHDADLFVSVHVNSSRNRRARGIETYYLNFATTPEAMEVAARENAITEKNMAELQKLTTAIAMNSKIEESRDFAGLVQAHLVSQLKKDYAIPSLGVKQAPFYVLIGAHMPAILAEISFISNQQESRLLNDDSYRQSVAEGIAVGVNRYISTLADNKLTQNRK